MNYLIYKDLDTKQVFHKLDTEAPDKSEEDEKRQKTLKYIDKISDYQEKLYAENKQSLLIVFQGVDVTSFKSPEPHELAQDFLWRVHRNTPSRGKIGVFNRSHYEDVLIVRVKNFVEESVWEKRYEHINAFEKLLSDNGTRILKFYLHISKKEERKRFDERKNTPEKKWKYNPADEEVQTLWDEYRDAYQDVFEKCGTKHAPWYIVPADNKWYRDFVVAKIICETLEEMDPKYPTT